jgi:general secretion pathway protein D
MTERHAKLTLALTLLLLLSACATTQAPRQAPPPAPPEAPEPEASTAITVPEPHPEPKIYAGSGIFVEGQTKGGDVPSAPKPASPPGAPVMLNFEGADIRDVVRNIIGDIMGESYTIDPNVGGTVTIRTTSGILRSALPATMEMLLRMNGATMTKEAGVWKILPAAAAVRGNLTPQLGGSNRALLPGYSVLVVPLHYVGVRQMAALLEPFVKDQTTVRVDDIRNLLILSGTELELKHLLDTIDMFDINWMTGMSAGVFTLESADVKTVVAELDKAFGTPDKSPLSGILRIIPIERMNALLIITPQPEYLEEAKKWIERLDRAGTDSTGIRFYIYRVQNGRAEHIGPLLQQAFTGRVTQQQQGPGAPQLAPSTPAGTIVSAPSFQPTPGPGAPQTSYASGATPFPGLGQAAQTLAQTPAGQALQGAAQGALQGQGSGVIRNVQVVADKDNNMILIVATPAEYAVIETALKKLDVPQRQVAIEVTIAEVTLTDELQTGLEWLFRGASPSGRGSGGNFTTSTPFNPATAVAAVAGATPVGLAVSAGFNYLINNANFPGGVQAALHLLDTYGSTKVISNPYLSALDNQKATIKVGDSIPIASNSTVGGTTNVITTTSQYIDTGVLLQVTPHINAGGLVTMEVDAEVSTPGTATSPDLAPPINTRSVQTLLAVPTGETMVMGGLIIENKQNNSAGLPLISRIPVLGGLFGNQTLTNDRTELILFITPHVVANEEDVDRIIDDLRRKMERLDDAFPKQKSAPDSGATQ